MKSRKASENENGNEDEDENENENENEKPCASFGRVVADLLLQRDLVSWRRSARSPAVPCLRIAALSPARLLKHY